MKSSRRRIFAVAGVTLAAIGARADLPRWLESLRAAPRYEGVFSIQVRTAYGTVMSRRPPRETREALSKLIAAAPADAELYALRARSAEEQLDEPAAEADWIQHAKLAADRGAGQLALADFYHRRLRPADEMRALEAAAQAGVPPSERFLPAARQRPALACERMLALATAQALPADSAYRLWIRLYPANRTVSQRYVSYLIANKQFAAVQQAIASYRKAFPADRVFPISARARLEEARGSADEALAIYDKAFEPLWPAELVKSYFAMLSARHSLSAYLTQARASLQRDPNSLNAASRIFYYHQQQGNLAAARRVLIEYRQRRDAKQAIWEPATLWTLGRLLEEVHDYDEAARNYHGLYALSTATAADRERALAALVRLLFSASEQPIRFGAGDLSYYKDIATMDPHPGFLNGILSLLLNSTQPEWRYSTQEQAAVSYFHRARAAELLALFDSKFPSSNLRAGLHARLIEAYASYSENDAVIRTARQFLTAFPKASQRTGVALRMTEAYARKRETTAEFAVYDELLKELAARADHVPLGEGAAGAGQQEDAEPEAGAPESPPPANRGARSPDYARVLDRYISRLVAMKRPLDAVRVLRGELDRSPNDPGLYARLAAFLEQNRLEAEVEEVYRRAAQQFSTMSWHDRLGRWYLRHKRTAQIEQLTRQVVDAFAGTELESYFRNIVHEGPLTAVLYRDLNLYAHERFRYDLLFVRNLLSAYQARGTADAAAYERLLREYWHEADDLRTRFFARLSSTGRLDAELQGLSGSSPAAARFPAEVNAWRSHFEDAASGLESAAAEFPSDAPLALRAASLDRSLAAFDAKYATRAVEIAERLHRFNPRDHSTLTTMGEIWAEREDIAKARPLWDQIARIEPGKTDGYLEAATIFWDYFQFDDALRLIEQARKQAGNPALYAYEAGAVYENERDYTRAIAEYLKDSNASGAARSRLLALARRPAHRALIDKATAGLVAGNAPAPEAVSLRIAVLDAQNRRAEVTGFLADLAARATAFDLVTAIRSVAESRGAESAAGAALEREASIAPDPLERMRARLALMLFYESHEQPERARAIVAELHQQHPVLLGIVRAATDFYWRNKMERQAVDVLGSAAAASNPTFRKQFLLEAATKATASADYGRARDFVSALLKDEPFDAAYTAAMASIFAAQHDDRGLRDFYEERIKAVREAPLAPAERTSRIAALRRNLIPVLTRQNEHAGAVDQYIEILRSYPEDESLAREAALYAAAHGTRDRLLAWFTKAAADSPRDPRWPMLLARVETAFEDLPAAIEAYSRASAIRPDRDDLLTARVALEERLMRFDAALASYTKLYDLTYRNPHWMEKAAEVHARLGRKADAVKALRVAFLEGRPDRPQPFFDIARILDGWDMPLEARGFAERGVALASQELLSEHAEGATLYARIMTRLRAHEIAIERLRSAAGSEPGRLARALTATGETVARYFTPEEKASLEAFLEKEKAVVPPAHLVLLAEHARMSSLEARWRFDLLMAHPGDQSYLEPLIQLQRRRLKNDELGVQLEAYWSVSTDENRDALLERAAEAFRDAGNAGAEMRVLAMRYQRSAMSGPALQRYFELLAAHAPAQLAAEAERGAPFDNRNLAAATAIASGNAALAFEAVRARGRGLPPVWTRAYTGLAGVYFTETTPEVAGAFTALLGDALIGARLGKPVDRSQQLAGTQWFPYGTIYGEYLALAKSGDPEEYLPALLEGTPARASAYATLADLYRENRSFDRALADYAHAIELDPKRGDVHDKMAVILWDENRRTEAVEHWKAAFAAFRRLEDSRLTEDFWTALPAALRKVGSRGLLAQVRSEADSALRTYIRRNGDYRAQPLIDGALEAAAGSPEGIAWILDLSRAAPSPLQFLRAAVESKRLKDAQRETIYLRILSLAEAETAQPGPQHAYMQDRLREERLRWITFLLDTKQAARAQAVIAALPEAGHGPPASDVAGLQLRAAAEANELPRLLESYARDPDRMPPLDTIRNFAAHLTQTGNPAARRLLEFVYTREIERQNFAATNFLGLAEVRLEESDVAGALALLRRMTIVSGEPFENLAPAADLLEKTGHAAEARDFRAARAKAVPWDSENRAAMGDAAAMRSPLTPYEARLKAARRAPGQNLGSAELDLLAGNARPAPAAAEQPYFFAARIAAAEAASDANTRLRLLAGAIAIDPAPTPPRLPLFRAALEADQPHTALAAIRPLLSYFPEPGDTESSGAETDNYWTGQFLGGKFGTAERAEIARGYAAASAAVGNLGQAVLVYRIALELAPSPQAEAALREVRAERERRGADAQRRPTISAELEQPNLVRPRLAPPAPFRLSGGTPR